MKNEPDLSRTIAGLVRSAAPVTPLERPPVRLSRWLLAATALSVVTVAILGVRPDVATVLTDAWFVARAVATLSIVLGAAIVVFSISVPGLEPSRPAHALPLVAGIIWAAMLAGTFAATGSPRDLLIHAAPHFSCVWSIAAAALSPALVLLHMLRQAAPLQAARTAGYAGLASLALGALAAQFVCANDAAAHHLLWHYLPVALLTVAGLIAGTSVPGRRAIGAR